MNLSRIQLTEAIAGYSQLGRLLQDRSYGMHRLLWDLFEKNERFLFREERSREQLGSSRNLPLYYVLSKNAPQETSPIFKVETKVFAPDLKPGDQLSFKLRANPTISRHERDDKPSKRHDVVMDAQRQWLHAACIERKLSTNGSKSELRSSLLNHSDFQDTDGTNKLKRQLDRAIEGAAIDWLEKRGGQHGFTLQSGQATGYRWNALPEKGRDAGFSSMDYEGVLVVNEPGKFVELLGKGFGPSKAFGCGLMLIQRI